MGRRFSKVVAVVLCCAMPLYGCANLGLSASSPYSVSCNKDSKEPCPPPKEGSSELQNAAWSVITVILGAALAYGIITSAKKCSTPGTTC